MTKLIFFELNRSLTVVLIYFLTISFTSATVSLTTDGLSATIQNDEVEIVFNSDATVYSIIIDGQNIALNSSSNKSFYLDYHYNNGSGLSCLTQCWISEGAYYAPTELTVVENTPERAHFYWVQKNVPDLLLTELHYLMVDGLKGIYCWVKCVNDQPSNVTVGITRMVYGFNPYILTKGTNIVRKDFKLYLYAYLVNQTMVQDETWQLPDGSYYSKYDFAGYFRETPYQGVYGNGYGGFLISASREYHSGGPLRQDLLVHQDGLILNIFFGTHMGTSGITAPPGWSHIYGPTLIYFSVGSDSEVLADVENRAKIEQANWPYTFVGDSEYPIQRGAVFGYITGQKNATVFLYDSITEPFESQALGYVFSTQTNSDGYFNLKNVRPGNYTLVAYPRAGNGSENEARKIVSIAAGDNQDIGSLDLPEPDNIMWALGETNRRSDGFRYSNESRNYVWQTLPPASLVFTVGRSNAANDWYYAQTKQGFWTIQYNDTNDGTSRSLRIALAAASREPHLQIRVNGHKVGDIVASNDHAIYRSAMQSGTFYSRVFTVNPKQVANGMNNITLYNSRSNGEIMYDAISLQKNDY